MICADVADLRKWQNYTIESECITLKSKGDKQFRTLKIDSTSWPQLDSESERSNYTGCHVLSCAVGTEEAELYSLESYLSLLEEENKGEE